MCGACGAGFLAGLRDETGTRVRLPWVGGLTRLGRSARAGLAVGVGLAGALAVCGLLVLLGKVLG